MLGLFNPLHRNGALSLWENRQDRLGERGRTRTAGHRLGERLSGTWARRSTLDRPSSGYRPSSVNVRVAIGVENGGNVEGDLVGDAE